MLSCNRPGAGGASNGFPAEAKAQKLETSRLVAEQDSSRLKVCLLTVMGMKRSFWGFILPPPPPSAVCLCLSVMKPLTCTVIPSPLYFSLCRSLLTLPWHPSSFPFFHTCCFMGMIKGTLTLKHERATPTPTTKKKKKKSKKDNN